MDLSAVDGERFLGHRLIHPHAAEPEREEVEHRSKKTANRGEGTERASIPLLPWRRRGPIWGGLIIALRRGGRRRCRLCLDGHRGRCGSRALDPQVVLDHDV